MMNFAEVVLMSGGYEGDLYHSETYLGKEYDEGLRHWKYIKKYKNSKGKWTYVYADKHTHDQIKGLKERSDKAAVNSEKYAKVADAYNQYGYVNEADQVNQMSKDLVRLRFQYLSDYEHLLDNSDIKGIIKRGAKNFPKTVKSLPKDTVSAGTKFIEKILGGTENYYAKPKQAKRPLARKKNYSGNTGGVYLR